MTRTPDGRTVYIQADVTDPDAVLGAPGLRDTLDPAQPVALTMCLLLHWIPAEARPQEIVRRLVRAPAPGSHPVVTVFAEGLAGGSASSQGDFAEKGTALRPLPRTEVLRFFEGMDLVEPGLVVPQHWRPGAERLEAVADADAAPIWAGVGIKRP